MTFAFTNDPTQTNNPLSDIENTESRLEELADYVNDSFPVPILNPSSASSYQALVANTSVPPTGLVYQHVLRADGGVSLTGVSSLAVGDVLYFNGTNFVRLAAGTAGYFLQANGAAAPSWVSTAIPTTYVRKTANFNIADGGRYAVDTSGGAINAVLVGATSSVDDEFIVTPTSNASFETNAVTVVRFGSEQIAGGAASFVCNINAEYHFRGNITGNWDVTIRPLLR